MHASRLRLQPCIRNHSAAANNCVLAGSGGSAGAALAQEEVAQGGTHPQGLPPHHYGCRQGLVHGS